MHTARLSFTAALFLTMTLVAAERPQVKSEQAFGDLSFTKPLAVVWLPGPGERRLVVEQAGAVRLVAGAAPVDKPLVLDWRGVVRTKHNEEGLLHLALHPNFAQNGRLFVWRCMGEPNRQELVELRMAGKGATIEAASAKVIIAVDSPADNHNGGTIAFGADGMLYLSGGDGGRGGDPWNHGQRLDVLHGKVLRLDVDQRGRPYAIPRDNPFVGRAGVRGEIWAYGLRNVWRMSFDRTTGLLWAGDVGQNTVEEVSVIEKGGNHGWNIKEGFRDFKPRAADGPLVAPVHEYDRKLGISITGGYVYRGSAIPALVGWYVYGDFQTGRVWALRQHDDSRVENIELFHDPRHNISSFAEDLNGELYYTAFNGRIYRLVDASR